MFTRRKLLHLLWCIPALSIAGVRLFHMGNKREVNVSIISDVSRIDLSDGLLIRTCGYYHANDGGGALYLVSKPNNINMKRYTIKISDLYVMELIADEGFTPLRQLGVHFDGMHDDTELLREIFNFPGDYYLDEGKVIVSDYIELSSNIKLFGSGVFKTIIEYQSENGNWLFINGKKGERNFLKGNGYNGRGNYHFRDFTIDLRGDIAKHSRSAMIFGRAANVNIENIVFMNGKNSHRIECNSQSNFIVNNCFFINTIISDNSSHEEINIDFNNEKGFPAFGQWDHTPCENIFITSCCFLNVQAGLGSHSYNIVKHKNVKVDGCVFHTIKNTAIRFQSIENSMIERCRFENIGGFDIILLDASNNKIINNVLSKKESAISFQDYSNLNLIKDNDTIC